MKTLSIIMINLLLFSFSINGTSQKNETNNILNMKLGIFNWAATSFIKKFYKKQ